MQRGTAPDQQRITPHSALKTRVDALMRAAQHPGRGIGEWRITPSPIRFAGCLFLMVRFMEENYMTGEELEKRNIAAMGEAPGKQYSLLNNEVAILHLYWREYIELFGTNQKRVDRLNQTAPGFFRMLQTELFQTNILHLARLTDPPTTGKKENLSLQNLPELVTDAALKKTLTDLLALVTEKTEFCRDWRNRRFAHHDLALATDAGAKPLETASKEKFNVALKSLADEHISASTLTSPRLARAHMTA